VHCGRSRQQLAHDAAHLGFRERAAEAGDKVIFFEKEDIAPASAS
jgi:hypothetical protein